jgi:hypothetical protein
MINIKAPINMASSPTSITISPIGVLGPHGPAPGTKLRITASIPHPPVISPLFQSFTNSLYHGFVTDGSNLVALWKFKLHHYRTVAICTEQGFNFFVRPASKERL